MRAGTDTGTTAARGMSAPALRPATADDRATARPMRVLFLCTGNSCRSILAEATFNHLAPPHWRALSAGSRPTGQVHPRSLALLRRAGIPTDGYHSKSWDALPEAPDLLITVCASAAGEACPLWPGDPVRVHWGYPDPSNVAGDEAARTSAFEITRQAIGYRMLQLLELPIATMPDAELREALLAIGRD